MLSSEVCGKLNKFYVHLFEDKNCLHFMQHFSKIATIAAIKYRETVAINKYAELIKLESVSLVKIK